MKVLVSFAWDCGRQGDLRGLFICTQEELDALEGKEVYFGEVLGKHSEIYGSLQKKDFRVISVEQDKIDWLEEIMNSKSISGFNPMDYL